MHKKTVLTFLLTVTSLAAQQFTVDASQTTATQAILKYTSTTDSACSVQVSESATLSPLDHDVDPNLFPGADQDSRAGNVTAGRDRTFVVGVRRSDLAVDGKLYSRALQANTQHFFQVTCGSNTATGQFSTANPPLGNSYSDNPPFNAAGFGNYGWPTIDWLDQSKVYIDPLTGIAIKRFTQPGAFGYVGGNGATMTGGALPISFDVNSAWTNSGNISSGVSTSLATYSGSASDPIFVAWDNNNLTPAGTQLNGYYPYNFTLDDLQINVFGNGTDSSAANRTVSVCLTYYDSHTCQTNWYDIILPQTLGSSAVSYPASTIFPNGGFWAGWGTAPPRSAFGVWTASVSVTGNTVTNAAGAFNTAWKAGGKYHIAGSSPACPANLCTIATIANNQSMTIVESPGSLTNVAGYSASAGFIIRKKTGTGSVSISAASQYAVSHQALLPGFGGFPLCNSNPVTVSYAADGVTPIAPVAGEFCLISGAAPGNSGNDELYLLIPSTGETRLLNPLYVDNGPQGTQAGDIILGNKLSNTWGSFDSTDPNTFYGSVSDANGRLVILKARYQAGPKCVYQAYTAGANHLPLYATASHGPGQDPSAYWYNGPQSKDSMDGQSSCLVYTNQTLASTGRDVNSQIQAQSNYKSVFGAATGALILGGKAEYTVSPQREDPALLYVFDLATGNLQFSGDTFSNYPLRWAALHSGAVQASDHFVGLVQSNGLGYYSNYVPDQGYFRGPYTIVPTAVWKSGSWSTNTSLPADGTINIACPAGLSTSLVSNGASGNNCIQFQSYMACNVNPYKPSSGQTEAQAFPCPYNPAYSMLTPLAPGDFIRNLQSQQSGGQSPYEFLQIVQVTSAGSNLWTFTASRVASSGVPCAAFRTYPEAWPNGWTGMPAAQCGANFYVDTTNLSGGYFAACCGGHFSAGVGSSPANTTIVQSGQQGGYPHEIIYQQPFTASPQATPWYVSADIFFHGLEAATQFQSYPSNMQMSAQDPVARSWFLDFNSLNPAGGFGWELPSGNITPFQTPATLVAGTSTVWQFGAPTGSANFKIQPVIAYAGGYTLQDASSPATGNIISDSTPWKYCVVYAAGECRTGSAVGQVYMSVPSVGGGYSGNIGFCNSNTVQFILPCANTIAANGAEIIQARADAPDPQALNWRRIGMGLMGPGRQYEFSTAVPDPTGTWAIFACNWCDGVRNELLMAKLPPLPGSTKQTQAANDFQFLTVKLGPDAELDTARVRFGYGENGNPASLYCTTRQENCSTTTTSSMPFAYESENPVWQTCSGGCTIQVPALPGRVLYYAIDRKSSSGGRIQIGDLKVKANP